MLRGTHVKAPKQEETGPLEKLEEEGAAEASGASARPGGSLREVRRGVRQWGVRETLSFTRPVRLQYGELEGRPRWPR